MIFIFIKILVYDSEMDFILNYYYYYYYYYF